MVSLFLFFSFFKIINFDICSEYISHAVIPVGYCGGLWFYQIFWLSFYNLNEKFIDVRS